MDGPRSIYSPWKFLHLCVLLFLEMESPSADEPGADLRDTGNENPSTPEDTSERSGNGSRARTRNPEAWKRNAAKKGRNTGVEHLNQKGKTVPARVMGGGCDEKCRLQCHERVTEGERRQFFQQFWSLGDINRQRMFLSMYTSVSLPDSTRGRGFPTRKVRRYSIKVKEKTHVICQKMFLSTLNTSDKMVKTAETRFNQKGALISPDKRGKHSKVDKEKVAKITKSIDDHIRLFDAVPSHFTRKRSKRKYLPQHLSIAQMHRLYLEWMKMVHPGEVAASESRYRQRFCSAFNFGFFQPKKDQCETCNVYLRASPELRVRLNAKYEEHQQNKELARLQKERDKEAAKQKDSKTCFAVFDLQKVLVTPRDETGVNHYKRTLSTYDLTFYDGARREGHCFV